MKTPASPRRRYDPEESVGHLIARITLAMRRRVEPRMAELGLTATQWKPLWMLETGMARTAQEMTCLSDSDAGAMTRLLDRLEAKGLVERERSADDRRVVQLALTEAGREVVRRIPEVLDDVNNRALRGFSAQEVEALKSMLKRIGSALAEDNPQA